jgi:hypothetical protein
MYQTMPAATNTGRKDTKGRSIWKGPRGGEFVMIKGEKRPPAKGHYTNTGEKNAIGRTIVRGSRGKQYAIGADGRRTTIHRGVSFNGPTQSLPKYSGGSKQGVAVDTGRKDADGRIIWRGPRGGLFVKTSRTKTGKAAPRKTASRR